MPRNDCTTSSQQRAAILMEQSLELLDHHGGGSTAAIADAGTANLTACQVMGKAANNAGPTHAASKHGVREDICLLRPVQPTIAEHACNGRGGMHAMGEGRGSMQACISPTQ